MAQPLLTPASVALSLAPPRSPPHGSVLRNLYANPEHHHGHLREHITDDHGDDDDDNRYQSHTLRSRLLQAFTLTPRLRLHDLTHPHLPHSISVADQVTRFLGTFLTLETQHAGRDQGHFKAIADGLVTLTCPLVGAGHPRAAREFVELSRAGPPRAPPRSKNGGTGANGRKEGGRRRNRWTRKRVQYGDHSMQFFDLFLPTKDERSNDDAARSGDLRNKTFVRGTLFFVHGGAWGSGRPWMYRLVAPAFLKLGFAVVVVGYRTYPDAPTIDDQCGDVRAAWDRGEVILNDLVVPVRDRNSGDGDDDNGWVGNVVCGHSSGAHVGLLMLVDMIGERMRNNENMAINVAQHYPWHPDYFVGLSGPYDISYHFDYEAGRGVEQISPMGAICGHSRDNFDRASPVKRLLSLFGKQREEMTDGKYPTIQQLAPPILLVHGIEDSTVPFTATSDAGRLLRSCGMERCEEVYLEETGHQDVVMHFMVGGPGRDVVLDWLLRCSRRKKNVARLRSRL